MKYMGSKSRIAKYIVPIIQKEMVDNNLHTYVEPFVGGANVIDKVTADFRVGCDKQKYLIELYKNLDKIDSLPEFVSKSHYSEVRDCYNRNSGTFEDWYVSHLLDLFHHNNHIT